MTKECKRCDYDNPIYKHKAIWYCPNCKRDYSLEYILIKQAEWRQ
jgi:ribosomal protein L37AE/L43A